MTPIRVLTVGLAAACLMSCKGPTETSVTDEPGTAAPTPEQTDAPVAEAMTFPTFEVGVDTVTESGLTVIERETGTGTVASPGNPVTVHYTGWLYDDVEPDKKGDQFDSSVDRDAPFRFTLGQRQVIPGWDEGVAGMRVGGKRTLIIPPDLAYGSRGFPPVIPPQSTLLFDVQLLGVEQ